MDQISSFFARGTPTLRQPPAGFQRESPGPRYHSAARMEEDRPHYPQFPNPSPLAGSSVPLCRFDRPCPSRAGSPVAGTLPGGTLAEFMLAACPPSNKDTGRDSNKLWGRDWMGIGGLISGLPSLFRVIPLIYAEIIHVLGC